MHTYNIHSYYLVNYTFEEEPYQIKIFKDQYNYDYDRDKDIEGIYRRELKLSLNLNPSVIRLVEEVLQKKHPIIIQPVVFTELTELPFTPTEWKTHQKIKKILAEDSPYKEESWEEGLEKYRLYLEKHRSISTWRARWNIQQIQIEEVVKFKYVDDYSDLSLCNLGGDEIIQRMPQCPQTS